MNASTVPSGSIVVGVDGSSQSDLAVTWAADQARLEKRPLTLAHGTGNTYTQWVDVAGAGGNLDDLQREAALSSGRVLLEQTRQTVTAAFPGVEVHTVLRAEDPRQALFDLAESASMLVVGSRGRGPVASLVMGSVSAAEYEPEISGILSCARKPVSASVSAVPQPLIAATLSAPDHFLYSAIARGTW